MNPIPVAGSSSGSSSGLEDVAAQPCDTSQGLSPRSTPLSVARIEHLWDTHVGTPNEKYPFSTKDVIDFAQSIEHECAGEAWKEAAIAWQVCASIHRSYAKPGSRGKDALYTTRQADFNKHAADARANYVKATGDPS